LIDDGETIEFRAGDASFVADPHGAAHGGASLAKPGAAMSDDDIPAITGHFSRKSRVC